MKNPIQHICLTGLLCAAFVVLSSCAAQQEPKIIETPQPLESKVSPLPASPTTPKATAKPPLPNGEELLITQSEIFSKPGDMLPELDAPKQKDPVERKDDLYSLSAQEVNIQTVLLALSQEIKQNIIIDPGIFKKVTIDLKNVTLVEALESLLTPVRLKYEIKKNFIHVTQQKMESRMFHLNYMISRRAGSSNLQSTSGQSLAGTQGGGINQNQGGIGGVTGNQNGQGNGSGRTFSNLFTFEETDLWREIYFGLKRIVTNAQNQEDRPDITQQSSTPGTAGATVGGNASVSEQESGSEISGDPNEFKEKGYFTINRQSGLIIVKDFPDVLLKVAEFLEAVEGSSQRQVFIRAKILEVKLNDEFKLGIDWSQVSPFQLVNDSDPQLSPSASGPVGTIIQSFQAAGSGLFTYGLSHTAFSVVINALQQQGNVSVLSSPKIVTLNNQRAVIKVGTEDVFFIPQISPATTTSASVTEFIPSSITIGIVMDVLPQINENGEVMMSINTSISERAGERVAPDGVNTFPILDVRESNNVVLANSGQTIVIGGLMQNRKTRNGNELPLLGKIPLLGRLFQYEEDVDEKTELVIMLTPEVLAGAAIDTNLKSEEERLRKTMLSGK